MMDRVQFTAQHIVRIGGDPTVQNRQRYARRLSNEEVEYEAVQQTSQEGRARSGGGEATDGRKGKDEHDCSEH